MSKLPESAAKALVTWADEELRSGGHPPWTWYRLMQIKEAIRELLSDSPVSQTANSQLLAPHRGTRLRLVESTRPQDTSQPRNE
jgi:hypothetical protein